MKKAIVLVVVLVAGGAAWLVAQNRRPDGRLRLSGAIEARAVQVGSLVGGRVSAVHVQEGDAVTAGQPIVSFETELVDAQVREQDARIAQARAGLDKARAGARQEEIGRARAEHDNAEADRRRLDTLRAQGIVAAQQYDAAATRARRTLETLRQLERGNRREDVQAAEAAVSGEEQRLSYLQRQRRETQVTAPAAGVVQSIDLRPGDLVAPNRAVASILEPDQLWVRVYVPEPRLAGVTVGQQAGVEIDGAPGRSFHGRVIEIASKAEYMPRNVQTLEQRSDQVFAVKVEVERAKELKPGMSALVTLEPGTR
jgi:HlyD family secretion protein